ncbi:MAG: hypothetical protein FJW40_17495 [Acidobacteria bacterium]|nr:hypothetical protein [Acidobacteriota bacterium]
MRVAGWLLAMAAPALAATQVYGHRGLMKEAPEDTLASYRACLQAGLDIEVDIQLTKDLVPVVLHDESVDRTTDGKGRVADLTLAELRKLDAGSRFHPRFRGERVPTFEEILELLKSGSGRMVIDHKDGTRDAERRVAALLRKHSMTHRAFVLSASRPILARYKEADPRIRVATIADDRSALHGLIGVAGIDLIWLTRKFPGEPDRAEVDRIRAAGQDVVQFFAAEEPLRWRRSRDNGVRLFVTDHPRELKHAIGD